MEELKGEILIVVCRQLDVGTVCIISEDQPPPHRAQQVLLRTQVSFNQGVIVLCDSFLEGHEEGQCSDGVGEKDQGVDREATENILEDAGQAETYRSKRLRHDYDAEKNEDLSAEGEGDARGAGGDPSAAGLV